MPTGILRLHVWRVVEPPARPILLLHRLGVGGVVWQPYNEGRWALMLMRC